MLIMSLVLSVAQLAFAVYCFGLPRRPFGRVLGFLAGNVLIVFVGAFCMFGSPVMLLHAGLLALALTGAALTGASRRRFVA